MSDTTSQPKTCHAAHEISTYILAGLLIFIGAIGCAVWYAKDHVTTDGFYTVSFGTNPLMQTADLIPDDFGKPAKPKKKVVATEPAATDFAPPLPQHKPTPPVAVQQ